MNQLSILESQFRGTHQELTEGKMLQTLRFLRKMVVVDPHDSSRHIGGLSSLNFSQVLPLLESFAHLQ